MPFSPFPDTIEAAAAAGIAAVIQPGGSVRDQESIDACNKHGIPIDHDRHETFPALIHPADRFRDYLLSLAKDLFESMHVYQEGNT